MGRRKRTNKNNKQALQLPSRVRWRTTDHCPHSTSIRSATSCPEKRLSPLKNWLGGRCTCRLNSCCHPWLLPLPSAGTEDRNALQTGSYGSHPRVRNSSATCQHSIGRQEIPQAYELVEGITTAPEVLAARCKSCKFQYNLPHPSKKAGGLIWEAQ